MNISNILNPDIDTSQLVDATAFDKISYINTLPINLLMQGVILIFPLVIWFFCGFIKGKSRKMLFQRSNYHFFIVFWLIFLAMMFLYDFPIWMKVIE